MVATSANAREAVGSVGTSVRPLQTLVHPVFLLCLALALAVFAYVYLSGKNTRPIDSDGWGYYLHLPATFIFGDVELSFLDDPDLPQAVAQYRFPDGSFQGMSRTETGYRDKYTVGPAVLQLPFFLTAWGIAEATLPSYTGFEPVFQVAAAVAGAAAFALGCFLAYRAARLRHGRRPATAALLFAIFATNILHYASYEPTFAHVYGFGLVAALLYLTIRRSEHGGAPPLWEFALFGGLMGLAVMVRPTNAVAALLYLIFIRQAGLGRLAAGSLLGLLVAALAASPQILMWLATTGQPIFYSYVGEGFRFLAPELSFYLFGVRKGVFFWHPAYLVMLVALIAQLRRRSFESAVLLTIVALNIYLGASWADPSFGDSFGCRQISEMIPLLILPLAALIERLPTSRVGHVAAGLAVVLAAINLLQFHGYMREIVPHNGTTMESYLQFWSDPLE